MNRMRQAIEASALAPTEKEGCCGRRSFLFADSFLGFAGHFPGYPILPGVLQNLLAQVVAEQTVGGPLQFEAIQRAKFSRQLRPDEQIDVSVDCQQKGEQINCKTVISVGAEEASTFTLITSRKDL